jgi:transcriptional regulator with XRE-family HTH domain
MKKSLADSQKLKNLRALVDKSQSRFAAMIGESKHNIISVENKRNPLTPRLARKIYLATGANLHADVMHWIAVPGENYNKENFDEWRSKFFPSDDETARRQFDRLKFWVELAFRAVVRSNVAQNRDRLPAICLSLIEWLDDARKEFKLETEIDEILEDETRYVGQERIPIWQLKNKKNKFDEVYLKKLADRLGVDYANFKRKLKRLLDPDVIVIEDEFRRDWVDKFDLLEPLEAQTHLKTPCKTRKLTSKPKYWFGKEDAAGNPIA